ncbi:MAG: hypothetical protein QOJ39_562 [Candidatus Eremiobacteraeota bacterium]|jgi:hypothetical protein|nr:hypothetical protein [Candidatus Eremiobacteraeota bacterium]MEA2718698.1 hypothetical protein [Candidatus Eremiobacteraeota bacterium]
MSLSRIIERRNAIVASPEPLMQKLTRIDDLVRATAVLALLSNDDKIRHVFDELLDLYIALSADALTPSAGSSTNAFVNRQAVVQDRTRRATRSRGRMIPAHLLAV